MQGKTRIYTDQQIQYIVDQYNHYSSGKKKVKITAFMKYLRQQWQQQTWLDSTPCRQTAADVLAANDCRKPRREMSTSKKSYYPKIKRYAPHVQNVMDGKQLVVHFNEVDYRFTLEMSKDMATDAIGGIAFGETETSQLVQDAFHNHCKNYQPPVATLMDNGKGNMRAAIDLGTVGTLFIHAHPGRAESKGQIEGEFGLFERNVSHITIEGKTAKEQALSFTKQIVLLYCRLRNQTPRCSVCPFTPAKLMKANLDTLAEHQYYEVFKAEQDRKQQLQEQRVKVSQEFHDLIDSIVQTHQLSGDVTSFKKRSCWIELSTFRQAEVALAKMKGRDNFDSAKQNLHYFYGIARNIQQEKDKQKELKQIQHRYRLDKEMQKERQTIKNQLEQKKEQKNQYNNPHTSIVHALEFWSTLPSKFRSSITTHETWIKEALQTLIKKKQNKQKSEIEKTTNAILSMDKLSLQERYQWINYVKNHLKILENNNGNTVTPK